ncbi:MAG TPA: anthranilate phosphoribosyltransferase [Acidobacteriaceae bacterium]|nr:anthranilate phosphoribosyltransferase [Acidobacteriaceae bacterium]
MPQPHLRRILEERAALTREQARSLMQQVLAAQFTDLELATLLGAIAARGEDAAELAGFVDAMRAAATHVPLDEAERSQLVDTCGTGGDSSGTFNISTAAALVAAAAQQPFGAPRAMVAKHGNRAVTSECGSADVLEALGIPVTLSPAAAAAALRRHRFAFLHAPSLHPAMKAVMPVRRALGVRTVFNILGPLTNPAGARAQVMGVYSAHLVPIVAEAMRQLNVRHAFVVHGATSPDAADKGLDELSISGPSQLAEVRNNTVTLHRVTPEQVGLRTAPIAALAGGNATTNAQILRAIFAGEPGPRRDVVLLNAAAVLITSGAVAHADLHADVHAALRAAIALAAQAIDSGAVSTLISALAADEQPVPPSH